MVLVKIWSATSVPIPLKFTKSPSRSELPMILRLIVTVAMMGVAATILPARSSLLTTLIPLRGEPTMVLAITALLPVRLRRRIPSPPLIGSKVMLLS